MSAEPDPTPQIRRFSMQPEWEYDLRRDDRDQAVLVRRAVTPDGADRGYWQDVATFNSRGDASGVLARLRGGP